MTKYFTREGSLGWRPCNARTLASAKRVSSARRIYNRTNLHVGIPVGDRIMSIAINRYYTRKRFWQTYEIFSVIRMERG